MYGSSKAWSRLLGGVGANGEHCGRRGCMEEENMVALCVTILSVSPRSTYPAFTCAPSPPRSAVMTRSHQALSPVARISRLTRGHCTALLRRATHPNPPNVSPSFLHVSSSGGTSWCHYLDRDAPHHRGLPAVGRVRVVRLDNGHVLGGGEGVRGRKAGGRRGGRTVWP